MSTTGLVRGAGAGAVTPTLATAAHGLAGGGAPTGTAATLLVAVALAGGVCTARLPIRWLPLALAIGQVAAHGALTLTAHTHDAGTGADPRVMVAAHVVAVIGCAALLASAEHLYRCVSHTVWVSRPFAPVPPEARPLAAAGPHAPALWGGRAPPSLSRRGPPGTDRPVPHLSETGILR